jgi:hypothetical protein
MTEFGFKFVRRKIERGGSVEGRIKIEEEMKCLFFYDKKKSSGCNIEEGLMIFKTRI